MKMPLIGGLISKIKGIKPPTQTTSSPSTTTNNVNVDMSALLTKVDELIEAHNTMMEQLKNGGIAVYLDGRKVSNQIAIASR